MPPVEIATALRRHWWLLLVYGLISLTFGVLALVWPSLSLVYVVVSVALWMLFASIAHFTLARTRRPSAPPRRGASSPAS